MYVLEDLWWGNISPCDSFWEKGSAYAKLREQANEQVDVFCAELSDVGKAAFESFCDYDGELEGMYARDSFVLGVRFGARMILDVVGGYDSPLARSRKRGPLD